MGYKLFYPYLCETPIDKVGRIASGDVLLWQELEYMDLLEKEILDGNIPMSRLDDAVRRILDLKEKLGLLDGSFCEHKFNQKKSEEIINTICDKAITLVQNPKNVLPLQISKKF